MNEVQQNTPAPAPQGNGGGEGNNTKKWVIIAVVVIVGLYALQYMFSPARMIERGVERSIERSMEQAGGGNVDVDFDVDGRGGDGEANYTVTGPNGETFSMNAGGNVDLPDNWPESVAILNDANVSYAGTMMGADGKNGLTAVYTTKRSPQEAADYYKSELSSKGWTIAGTMATPDGSMITAQRGANDEEGVYVYIGGSPEGTTVTVTVSTPN